VRDLSYASGSTWLAAAAGSDAGVWRAPCHDAGCRVRYRFALREAASSVDSVETAMAAGGVVVAPPSTWLVRPDITPGRFRFHVVADPPVRFAVGTRPAPGDRAATYEASTFDFDDTSFAVIGPFDDVAAGPGVDVAVGREGMLLTDDDVRAWAGAAVGAIASYFGKFPVDRALVVVVPGRAGTPTRGETLGAGGPAVLVRAAGGLTAQSTRDDWVMTHELIHVVFPSLAREHVWLSEGIPTYLEPVIRVRAGLITAEKFWGDLVDGLPQGLPEAGDQGLERTHTWGRTYWGGALFCLVADVTIRERTGGARSIDDAFRAIVARGDVEQTWTIDEILDVGDHATGTRVLHDLYESLALAPGTVDLAALWARLGVKKGAAFDDAAPLAALRRAITAAPAPGASSPR
jgi:hypothetical protein